MNPILPLRAFIPLVLMFSVLLASIGSYGLMSHLVNEEIEQSSLINIKRTMSLLQLSLNTMLRHNNVDEISILMAALATDKTLKSALVIDQSGRILFASRLSLVGSLIEKKWSSALEIKKITFNPVPKAIISLSLDKKSIQAVYPIKLYQDNNHLKTKQYGLLLLDKSMVLDKAKGMRHIEEVLSFFFVAMGLLSIAIWGMFNQIITKRVNVLLKMTAQIFKGNPAIVNELQGHDEFRRIENALVELSDELLENQSALSISEHGLQASQEFANLGSWSWDAETDELDVSERFLKQFNIENHGAKINYDFIINKVHPDDRDGVHQALKACLKRHQFFDIEHRIVLNDGSIRWLHETGDSVLDRQGKVLKINGIIRDISDAKQMTFELKQTLHQLQYQKQAVDQHSLVAVTDVDGTITYANEKLSEVSGYSNIELMGSNHRLLNSGFHPSKFFIAMWETILTGNVWQGEICNRKKNGELYWLRTTIVPYLNEDGKPESFTSIRTDITRRVNALNLIAEDGSILMLIKDIQSTFINNEIPKVGFDYLLKTLLKLTNSEYGFIAQRSLQADKPLKCSILTCDGALWNDDEKEHYSQLVENSLNNAQKNTLYQQALSADKVVILNGLTDDWRSYNLSDNHPNLESYLGMKLYAGSECIGLIGLANGADGYDAKLVKKTEPILTASAQIMEAVQLRLVKHNIEKELKQFKTTVDKSLDCVFMFDPNTLKFLYVNQGAKEAVGYSYEELMGMSPADIKPAFNEAEFRQLLFDVIGSKERKIVFETIHQHKKGHTFEVEISLQYIYVDDEEPRFIAFVNDISERNKLQMQLQQAQKMESIGQLTGGIAHDFNNMLASILGFTNLAKRRYVKQDQPELMEYLNEVSLAGERARDLVSQLLDYSRTQKGQVMNLDIEPVIKELMKMLKLTIPPSITLSYQVEKGLPQMLMNPVQLHQILMNLILNARDSIAGNGRIQVKATKVYSRDIATNDSALKESAEIYCDACHQRLSEGFYIELSVQDNGEGIRPEHLKKIFEPFYTTKEIGKGTGMGLSTAHGIVHKYGGHIIVDSIVGSGTQFKIYLPLSEIETVNKKEAMKSLQQESNDLKGLRIFIVDDEKTIVFLIREFLESHGAIVLTHTDAEEALATFKQDPYAFDLMITDQIMPKYLGYELALLMLDIRPELPIILCSGYSTQTDETRAKEMGIKGYISKPIDLDCLYEAIKQSVNSELLFRAKLSQSKL